MTQETDGSIDEADLRLINALQLAPRASWTQLAGALDLDPVTLARRWQRLAGAGNAWITVSPAASVFRQLCTAFLEIRCSPDRGTAVAEAMLDHTLAVTVERASGDDDLLVTAGAPDLAAMSRFALEFVAAVDGVESVRTRLITQWFTEGSRWRLNALGPEERSTLPAARRSGGGVGAPAMSQADRALLRMLSQDGRMSLTDLAAGVGISAPAARRRLDRLLQLELVTMRCEFARPLAGYAVLATFWGRVPPAGLEDTGRRLSREPEVRNCFALHGPNNLVAQVWLRSVGDLGAFEQRLADGYPDLEVRDRSVVLRLHKLLGHVLDERGRRVRSVVPDVWGNDEGPSPRR
ncbi:Lrp/AsnC family transcriptional regulator [Rhodococcus sp. NPDC004095]